MGMIPSYIAFMIHVQLNTEIETNRQQDAKQYFDTNPTVCFILTISVSTVFVATDLSCAMQVFHPHYENISSIILLLTIFAKPD